MLVTAIKDHSLERFKQGDQFTIQGMKYLKCGCVLFDIGIRHAGFNVHATCMHGVRTSSVEIGWYASYMFTPSAEVTHAVTELISNINGTIHSTHKEAS